MSFFSYLLTSVATSVVLGTVACAQNADTISHSKTVPDNKMTQSKKIVQDFNKINFTGSYLAARAARIHFDFDNAQKNAENSFVLTSMKDPYLAEQAIRLSLIQQDLDSAVELANQHIKQLKLKENQEIKEPIGVFSVLTLLVDRMKCNEPKQALALFEQLQISFNKPMRALIGGSIYRLNGDVKKAELIEANLSGFDLFDMMRIYHAANNAYMVGNHDKALTLFEKSGKYTDALAVRSLLSAVQIYLKNGEKQKAVDLLQFHRRSKPDGLIWAASESLEKGEDFKFGLPKNYLQVMGEDLYNIGILYARQSDYESAIAFFRIAQIAGVSHAYLLSGLAEAYSIIKDYDTAAELYLNIAKDDQFLIGRESLVGAALTLNAAERYTESEKLLTDAIEKDKTYYRYPYVLGDLLRGRQEYKRAIPYFTQALEAMNSENLKMKWRILYGRAIAYEQIGDWDKAEKDFLAALELAPNNPDLINYLAYSWVDRGIHLEKALLMLQHAVNNRPDSGYIADSLGWALFRIGKYNEALPILENAIALMPSEPVINEHLGDVYWKIGRKHEAVFQWNHALDFKPNDKDKEIIEAKIAVGYDKAQDYLKTKKVKQKNTVTKENHADTAIENGSFFNMIKSFFNRFSGQN
jgi:tetratricopeptide (TPR) repeat protein